MVGASRALKSVMALSGLTAALLCGGSPELSAQEVHLRPQFGLYIPTKVSIQKGVFHISQKVGFKAGARLIVSFNERFDLVTGVTYMPGYALFHQAGEEFELATGGHALTATTGAQYWLIPPTEALSWEVHSAVGLVFGGRPSYDDLFANSTVNGIMGTTLRYRVGRIVSFLVRIQDRVFQVRSGAAQQGRSRSPLQLSFGLGFPFLESTR
jgi:hypothetical protein